MAAKFAIMISLEYPVTFFSFGGMLSEKKVNIVRSENAKNVEVCWNMDKIIWIVEIRLFRMGDTPGPP